MGFWDKIATESIFVIQMFASLSFLAFSGIFFFVKDARSMLLGTIMLVVFVRMQKGEHSIKQILKDRKEFNRAMLGPSYPINKRYSFAKKEFVKKKS